MSQLVKEAPRLTPAASAVAPEAARLRGEGTHVLAGMCLRCSFCLTADATSVCAECARFLCDGCRHSQRWWARSKHVTSLPMQTELGRLSVFCKEHRAHRLSPAVLASAIMSAAAASAWRLNSEGISLLAIAGAVLLAIYKGAVDHALSGGGPKPVQQVFGSLHLLRKALWHQVDSVGLRHRGTSAAIRWLRRILDARRQSGERETRRPPSFGMLPHYEVKIKEEMLVDFALGRTASGYVQRESVHGTLNVALRFADEPRGFVVQSDAIAEQIHAGFVAFGAQSPISCADEDFVGNPATVRARPLTGHVPLSFDLTNPKQQAVGKVWTYRCEVTPRPLDGNDAPPRWAAPMRVLPSKDQSRLNSHTWGLTFQCAPDVNKLVIKDLRVDVPPELESVKYTDGISDRANMQVLWHDIVVTPSAPATVVIEFARPIYETQQLTATYSAWLEDHLLSGLKWDESRLWYPTGQRALHNHVSETRGSRLFGSISVPTLLQPKFQEVIVRSKEVYEAANLDVRLAHHILAQLARRDLYAKNVAASDEEGSLGGNHWEVVGRQYVGQQPYDIHLVMADAVESEKQDTESKVRAGVAIDLVVRIESQVQFVERDTRDAHSLATDLLTTIREGMLQEATR